MFWNFKEDINTLLYRPPGIVATVDGFRVFFNISVILCHICFVLGMLVPVQGPQHDEWIHAPFQNLFNFGSVQVDGFLVLSGYLFALQFARKTWNKEINFSLVYDMLSNRLVRLSLGVYFFLLVASIIGDPDIQYSIPFMTFLANYISYPCLGLETLQHTWSNSLEVQCFFVFMVLFIGLSRVKIPKSVVLWILFALSFFINNAIYDRNINSTIILGKRVHPSYYFTLEGKSWLENHFGYQMNSSKSCSDIAEQGRYMPDLYLPFHTRYAAFALGCIIGLKLADPTRKPPIASTTSSKGLSYYPWVALGWLLYEACALFILSLILPQPEGELTPQVEWFANVAFRQTFAVAFGFIFYCSLVEEGHPFYSRGLRAVFGHKIFYPLAQLAYGSYLFHYRIILSLLFFWMPTTWPISTGYLVQLVVLTLVLSFVASLIEYLLVEGPSARWRHRKLEVKKE